MGSALRLRDGIFGLAALGMAATPMAASANDIKPSDERELARNEFCHEVSGYPGRNCASPGYAQPRSLDDIKRDPALSDTVVLHFGPGFADASLISGALRESDGFDSVAIPGGPEGKVQLVIAGWTHDGLVFDQDQANSGRVGTVAAYGYPKVQARKDELRREAALVQTSQLASTTPGGRD